MPGIKARSAQYVGDDAASLDMTSTYTSPGDKLARQLLKQIERTGDRTVSRSTIDGWQLADEQVVSAAIAHAVGAGWLIRKAEGEWRITPAGEEIGKRTRAGIKNKRRAF